MYGSGIQTPTVSFSSITLTKIAIGSFFFGFDSDNGGAFSKIDRLGNLTVIEGAPITGAMVISALGFTPYDATNPAGYIDTTALTPYQLDLGFTPYDATNPDGFISGIIYSDVTTALGFTPYNATNPNGFIDITALAPYQSALGFTPEDVANKDIDGNLAANSDTLYPSQKAVKTYIDSSVTGVLDDRGNWDASVNVFPTTGGSGPAGSILKGDIWFVSDPGTLGTTPVVVGSNFRALIDNPSVPADWNILNSGVGYIPENSANKGAANGYASLDATGKVPSSQLTPLSYIPEDFANKGIANGYAELDATGKVPASQILYKTIMKHGYTGVVTAGALSAQRWIIFGGVLSLGAVVNTTAVANTVSARQSLVPKTGTIIGAKFNWYNSNNMNAALYTVTIRNRTTNTSDTITASFPLGTAKFMRNFSVSGLNIAVTENDEVFTVLECPSLIGSIPTNVYMNVDYIIE